MTNHLPAAEQLPSRSCLEDNEIIAAVDGEADALMQAHLQSCQRCAEQVYAYADLQTQLRRRLYRLFCPSSHELAAFHEHVLDAQRADMIARHIATCQHCAREVHLLDDVLGESPPRTSQAEQSRAAPVKPTDQPFCD